MEKPKQISIHLPNELIFLNTFISTKFSKSEFKKELLDIVKKDNDLIILKENKIILEKPPIYLLKDKKYTSDDNLEKHRITLSFTKKELILIDEKMKKAINEACIVKKLCTVGKFLSLYCCDLINKLLDNEEIKRIITIALKDLKNTKNKELINFLTKPTLKKDDDE